MKLIKPSWEILEQGPGLEGIYEAIERAGRTCYKSDNAIKYKYLLGNDEIEGDFDLLLPNGYGTAKELYDLGYREVNPYPAEPEVFEPLKRVSITAKGFVDKMIASQHYAMLEHGTVYLAIPTDSHSIGVYYHNGTIIASQFEANPYSRVNYAEGETAYVTTNYRVLVESFEDDIDFILEHWVCEPTEHHEKRVTVRFTTDRGVSHEFVRHRVFSFAQESTRYCNYSKDKFNNELTFIIPSWSNLAEGPYRNIIEILNLGKSPSADRTFAVSCWIAENNYLYLLKDHNLLPQQARQVLPNALKTELVMTGFVSDWNHFFDLRSRGTTGAPHPDAKALAEPLMNEFIKRKYIK